MIRIDKILMVLIGVLTVGCITNDIPYPRIQANFTEISAEGESRKADIDSANCVVTLYFPEDANIYQVNIDSYSLTPKSEILSGDLAKPIDLSSDYTVVLRLYQDYTWTIKASQNIEREFVIEGQVGTSEIDAANHTVSAMISKKLPIDKVVVTKCKLGPSSAIATPQLSDEMVDFTSPVVVKLDNYGHIEEWTITVVPTDVAVETVSADGWTCVGWVYGQAEAGKKNTVQYRIKGDTEWLTVPDSWITSDGGSFYARILGLTPLTTYEARAVSGEQYGETLTFVTGAKLQVPNSDFDQWWLDGKVWCPWPEGGEQVWDTGNKGATTLGPSNTVPTDDTVTGQGQAAMLQTKFVGIGMLGKLAAGNIFVGRFVRTDGTNGVLSFGYGFDVRPTKLKGYLKYKSAPISSTTTGLEYMKGQPDTCSVWIALIDTPEPFEIRTNPKNRQLFDPDGDYVVAYGSFQSGEDIPEYIPFEIDLKYKSTSRVPTYILITASASKYGDYFTGGNGSVLYVDDFKLEYDYEH